MGLEPVKFKCYHYVSDVTPRQQEAQEVTTQVLDVQKLFVFLNEQAHGTAQYVKLFQCCR